MPVSGVNGTSGPPRNRIQSTFAASRIAPTTTPCGEHHALVSSYLEAAAGPGGFAEGTCAGARPLSGVPVIGARRAGARGRARRPRPRRVPRREGPPDGGGRTVKGGIRALWTRRKRWLRSCYRFLVGPSRPGAPKRKQACALHGSLGLRGQRAEWSGPTGAQTRAYFIGSRLAGSSRMSRTAPAQKTRSRLAAVVGARMWSSCRWSTARWAVVKATPRRSATRLTRQ